MEDREADYDSEITPLMDRIIAICKEQGIPMITSFQLNDGLSGEEDQDPEPLFCTTLITQEGCDSRIVKAGKVILNHWDVHPPFVAMTITSQRR
jgi:hypothetical protein